jgi:hypothetical protein
MQLRYGMLERVGLREALPIFRKRGWFGIERHLDALELHELLEIHRKPGGGSVDRFICRRFAANRQARLRSMIREWSGIPYLAIRRRKVLLALKAHAQRQFALSIPLLLTFADGLAAAYFRANPATLPPAKGSRKATIHVPEAAGLYQAPNVDYAQLLTEAISEKLYSRYVFGQKPPSALNRHGILHGDIEDFDSEANSLKAWLLLGAIAAVALQGPKVP